MYVAIAYGRHKIGNGEVKKEIKISLRKTCCKICSGLKFVALRSNYKFLW
jgi:hypothetical protein